MGEIKFRSKKDGKVKFIADKKGAIQVLGKDGKIKETLQPNDTNKTEIVKITPKDLK